MPTPKHDNEETFSEAALNAPEGSVARIFDDAVEALMGCAITRREALAVLKAIFAGLVPHVELHY